MNRGLLHDRGELYFDYERGRYGVWNPDDYSESSSIDAATHSDQSESGRADSPNLLQRILRWF
jgi:hypothetical protein